MATNIEKESLDQLKQIEEQLVEIKEKTPTPRRAFINGILQGSGAVVGSILAVVLLGYLLSLFGIIPGLGSIVHSLQSAMHSIPR
jgi:hypothetical protein